MKKAFKQDFHGTQSANGCITMKKTTLMILPCFVFIKRPVLAEITHCEFNADICVLILG